MNTGNPSSDHRLRPESLDWDTELRYMDINEGVIMGDEGDEDVGGEDDNSDDDNDDDRVT